MCNCDWFSVLNQDPRHRERAPNFSASLREASQGEDLLGEGVVVWEAQNNVSTPVKKSDRTNSRNGREIFPKPEHYCQDVGQSKYLNPPKRCRGGCVWERTRTPEKHQIIKPRYMVTVEQKKNCVGVCACVRLKDSSFGPVSRFPLQQS